MAASAHVQERLPDEFTDEQQMAGCKDPLKQIDIAYSQHGEMQKEKKKKKGSNNDTARQAIFCNCVLKG